MVARAGGNTVAGTANRPRGGPDKGELLPSYRYYYPPAALPDGIETHGECKGPPREGPALLLAVAVPAAAA